jgi:DNA-binding transcriptional regulator YbjK
MADVTLGSVTSMADVTLGSVTYYEAECDRMTKQIASTTNEHKQNYV